MTKTKKPTVTIGIPAHNEESGVGPLLDSILVQDKKNFALESVLILCDNCTDNTNAIAKKYAKKYKFISVIDDGQRLGQAGRLRQIYAISKSDIIVTLDADVTLADRFVIENLVKNFSSPKVGLVGGRAIPKDSKTIIGKALATYEGFWFEVTKQINNGNNIHNNIGPISAVSKALAKKLNLPNASGADHWNYFKTLELGYLFRFAPNACVYFKVPQNLSDFIHQQVRFRATAKKLKVQFKSTASDLYKIPKGIKIKAYLKIFLQHPFLLSIAVCLQVILAIYLRFSKPYSLQYPWDSITTSK